MNDTTTTSQIITIDGGAATGKGTVSKLVAKPLGFNVLDSGAVYRTLTYLCFDDGVPFEKPAEVIRYLKRHSTRFKKMIRVSNKGIYCGHTNMEEYIRTRIVSKLTPTLARIPEARKLAMHFQRGRAENCAGLVAEGRDMGSVVFPKAKLKIFLTVSPHIAAKRRAQDVTYKEDAALEKMEVELENRNREDQERKASPLIPPPGCIIIDTDIIPALQVAEVILSHWSSWGSRKV